MSSQREKGPAIPSADYPFESNYAYVNNHRIHYIEEGEGDPILFIHGNPTWSYLWRNIMPRVARESGKRGIAIDLLGFGKSDKPEDVSYSIKLHSDILQGFIEKLDLKNITFVLHDWGGPLGTAYAVQHPDNVRGIALMETFVWPLEWKDFGVLAPGFRMFRSALGYPLIQGMNMFVTKVLPSAVMHKDHMSEEVMRRYQEPFPTIGSRRAIRVFPQLLPIDCKPDESSEFIEDLQTRLAGVKFPMLFIKATPGAIVSKDTEYHLHLLQKMIPQLIIKDFGPGLHYLQEDDPDKVSDLVMEWMHQCTQTQGARQTTILKQAA